jgi:voltage-gated potassium channel
MSPTSSAAAELQRSASRPDMCAEDREARDETAVLKIRGCMGRSRTQRELLAHQIYLRLHPIMATLGLLFVVVVLSQRFARDGTLLQRALLAATWLLWASFVAEYVLRLVIAPSTGAFLRRTWWQVLFLVVPVMTLFRALLFLRIARPTRVALAALRGGRSARSTLTGRGAWLAALTAIVVFGAADVLYGAAEMRPYGAALHAAALAAITGEPTGSDSGVAQVLDVVLALYAVVFFASLAGIFGAFFLEQRQERRTPGSTTAED